MPYTALVTGADRGLGYALCAGLLAQGWQVFAGQYMPTWPELTALYDRYPANLTITLLDVSDENSVQRAARQVEATGVHLDMLINNAGVLAPDSYNTIRQTQNYAEMQRVFEVNALGPLRMVQAFLPLMAHSTLKRLCFVSSEAGSVGRSRRVGWYGYCMSKAALNMMVKNLFNELRPEGYTFRLYHPGWIRSYMSGVKNLEAKLEPEEAAALALRYFLATQMPDGSAFDEDHLALRDYEWKKWRW
ncbi:MAG: SDR family oxidoreductase [Chloroflexota bacterium]